MFDRLYFKNGTFYIVTDDPSDVPPMKLIISSGVFLTSGAADELKRLPSDKDMRIIEPAEAKELFGEQAQRLDGVTVCMWLLCAYYYTEYEHSGWPTIQNNCKYPAQQRVGRILNGLQHHTLLPLVCRAVLWVLANVFLPRLKHPRERRHRASRT